MSDYPPTVPPATPPPPGGGSYTPPPPPPPGGGGYTPPPALGGGGDRTLWLILSYLGILSLIPWLAKKDDAEVQWHAKNGVALFGAEVVVWIVLFILSIAMRSVLSCGLAVVNCVVWIGFFALSIYCILQAVNGKRPRLPVITDMAEKL